MELVHNSALYSTTYFFLLPQSLHVLYKGIKAMLRGILVIRFGNTISLLIPSKRTMILFLQNVQFEFRQVLCHYYLL